MTDAYSTISAVKYLLFTIKDNRLFGWWGTGSALITKFLCSGCDAQELPSVFVYTSCHLRKNGSGEGGVYLRWTSGGRPEHRNHHLIC